MTAGIGAVVVRWKGGEEVDRCLTALLSAGGERLQRVVLVDSGSGDGGAERLAMSFPQVQVLALAENRSFAWAANQGAAACPSPYLLLLNPDTEVMAGGLAALAGFLDHHPQAAGVVPLLTSPDGSSQHRWQLRHLPTLPRLVMGLPGAPVAAGPEPAEPLLVPQPAAAAWLLRRPVWEALAGLDPAFAPAWWEDVDLCTRLAARLGSRDFPATEGFWLLPAARVVHLGGSSVVHLGEGRFLAAYYRNLLLYAQRHRPRQVAVIRIGLRLSLLTRAVARPRRWRAYRVALAATVDRKGASGS